MCLKETERSRNFEPVEKGTCWKKRSENTGQKRDESRKKRASGRGDTVASRDNERDSFSLGDERREG